MVHKFNASDWVEDRDGERLFVVGRSVNGVAICQTERGEYVPRADLHLKRLPGCTGWDWLPQQLQADAPDDDPDGIDENDDDDAYVCLRIKRAVWDAIEEGGPLPTDSITDATEMVKLVQMPGAKLLLLPG